MGNMKMQEESVMIGKHTYKQVQI